ncbi:MAG: hypothetical protein Q9225_003570 [Loekoesia sp. 1 TL-2023]
MTSSTSASSNYPSPISWPPSQYWEVAGGWSSFALQIGTPAQIVRVLISTAGQATWAISSLSCTPDLPPSCSQTRGDLFNNNKSRTWTEKGFYGLDLETNLYPPDNATYGLDTVALDFTNATGGPVLEDQVVAALSGSEYVLGTFGLGQQPTNFSDFTEPHPSFLTSLYNKQLIPSLSWSYTAGAQYRLKGVFGSLTLGGYDAARFTPNNVSFNLAPDISRDLVVGLQGITSTESNGSTQLLLPSAHLMFIDSTVPYIYLPLDACELFERVFGLVWNSTYEMYLVDDALHQTLVTRSPIFKFEIGNSRVGGPTVEITLPYASFDLTFKADLDSAPLQYFPIQRAANDTQLTLGRAFLQEAYLTTDYGHGNFSVSQCRFEEPIEQDIVPILSDNSRTTTDSAPSPPSVNEARSDQMSRLGRQKIIGISIGAGLGFLLLLALCCWPCIARYRRKRGSVLRTRAVISSAEEIQRVLEVNNGPPQASVNRSTSSLRSIMDFYVTNHDFITEIDTNSWNILREVPGNGRVELPENPKLCELSHIVRSATSEDLIPRRRAESGPRPPLSPRRRRGLVMSTSGLLSTGNIAKYWMWLTGLRASQSENSRSEESSASAGLKRSYLEKSLPTTPISESPQASSFPAWTRIAKHQHEAQDQYPAPLRLQEDSFQHRRGFF